MTGAHVSHICVLASLLDQVSSQGSVTFAVEYPPAVISSARETRAQTERSSLQVLGNTPAHERRIVYTNPTEVS